MSGPKDQVSFSHPLHSSLSICLSISLSIVNYLKNLLKLLDQFELKFAWIILRVSSFKIISYDFTSADPWVVPFQSRIRQSLAAVKNSNLFIWAKMSWNLDSGCMQMCRLIYLGFFFVICNLNLNAFSSKTTWPVWTNLARFIISYVLSKLTHCEFSIYLQYSSSIYLWGIISVSMQYSEFVFHIRISLIGEQRSYKTMGS